jgi:hypothetical protein
MTNSTVLPVVAGGAGPTVVTSDLAATKTVIATNISGTIDIEASADGVNFCAVGSLKSSNDNQVIVVAAAHMRVVATNSSASSVIVIAEQSLVRSAVIPPPPVNEPGASIDVSSFGSITTVYVEKGTGGSIDIQISGDNINWATFKSFQTSGCSTEDFSTRFVRAVGNGATGTVAIASEEPAARALNSPAPAFVFRPGGIAGGNVYVSWAPLVAAMSSVQGRKMLEFDDSIVTPCVIPPGAWAMKDVVWAGYGPRSNPSVFRTVVDITEGAVFTDLRMIGGQITVRNKATATSPVSDFGAGTNHVHIGLRDDCGNSQIQNLGTVPMFALGANSVTFFVQNCLFGIGSTSPLIGHTGGTCSLNLLGQNQTAANLVAGAPGASVFFGALSSSASIGADQTSITNPGGTYSFGPLGRIQRNLLPLPPLPPATVSQTVGTPNALVRCNGTIGFTQILPQIIGGFKILVQVMYTGGQEVVIAEVVGGAGLVVAPFAGDTIDGVAGAVPVAPRGSRTFVSDGVSNWITTAMVP